MAAIVAHHALRLPGGARSVKNVERIGRSDRDAVRRFGRCHGLAPIRVAPRRQLCHRLFALQNDAAFRLVLSEFNGFIEQRFICKHPGDLDAATGRNNYFGHAIVDADGKLVRRKAPENY